VRKKKIIYLKLYNAASEVLRDNPCELKKDSSGHVTCLSGEPCCTRCDNLGPNGCTVQALTCRTWSCYMLQKAKPEVVIALDTIAAASRAAGIRYTYRAGIEEHLR
jgi:hypothetical protein